MIQKITQIEARLDWERQGHCGIWIERDYGSSLLKGLPLLPSFELWCSHLCKMRAQARIAGRFFSYVQIQGLRAKRSQWSSFSEESRKCGGVERSRQPKHPCRSARVTAEEKDVLDLALFVHNGTSGMETVGV